MRDNVIFFDVGGIFFFVYKVDRYYVWYKVIFFYFKIR